MATTTNFGWETPDDTDLVKDGALAMRTLGNAIDASMVDLKGGTTGQVLSKTSNTDMDFTWVTSDDANAIQNAIVDAKGDLITATAADTPARLAVGSNGDTLVADSAASTGLRWQGNYAAGKNAIINGDFLINQRNFTSNTTDSSFNFDRWLQNNFGGTYTLTPQTFTAGAAPVAGYEGRKYLQAITASQSAAGHLAFVTQRIEDCTRFAGQTVTVSFWAKADTGTPKIGVEIFRNYGTGGSPTTAETIALGSVTLSTSWARYSVTLSVTSLSGKTLGTTANTSYLELNLWQSAGANYNTRASSIGIQNFTASFWGVQVEAGSVATAFQTATGTLQGELAACQRYYYRTGGNNLYQRHVAGVGTSTTNCSALLSLPVAMRANPTSVDYSTLAISDASGGGLITITAVAIDQSAPIAISLNFTTASGLTQYRPLQVLSNGSNSAYLALNAEL